MTKHTLQASHMRMNRENRLAKSVGNSRIYFPDWGITVWEKQKHGNLWVYVRRYRNI